MRPSASRSVVGRVVVGVMSLHKLTTGDGYTYLTRHVAGGDVDRPRGMDAADYYTAEGNPPGQWVGRGTHLLGLDGAVVTEAQMRALFKDGMHPNAQAMITGYLTANLTSELSDRQRAKVESAATRAGRLGRAYPAYETLAPFADRVANRLVGGHDLPHPHVAELLEDVAVK